MEKTDSKLKWLWLKSLPGITKSKIIKLYDCFSDINNIFSAQREDYIKLSFLKDEDIESLCSKDLLGAREEYEKIKKADCEIICVDEELFPKELLCISNHPCVLYVKGKIINLNEKKCLSVVGARIPDEYGKNCAFSISKKASEKGIVIVSGMADGIDSYAHMGALDAGGYTVGVLGCGADVVYPKENLNLYRKILSNGMIISEYPLSTKPDRFRFPERNKIIAALSLATFVVQAREKSGSLITADLALKYGKALFSLPGNISSSLSLGTNLLLSKGAKIVSKIEDILDFYFSDKNENPPLIKEPLNLSDEENMIFSCLEVENKNIDEISRCCNIPVYKLYSLLLSLELKGYIQKDDTDKYFRCLL